MKVLKSILAFIVACVLTLTIMVLTSSFIVKEVLQNQVLGTAVKEGIISSINEESDVNKDKISEALDDPELRKIFNDLVDEFMNSMDEERYNVSDEFVDEVINYVVDNKDKLEEVTDSKIDIEEVKSDSSREDLKKSLNEAFDETRNLDNNVKIVLKSYSVYTSTKFRVILFVTILVLICILALLKGSATLWMKTTGVTLIINGVFASFLYILSKVLISLVNNNSDVTLNIKPTIVIIIGVCEIVGGIVLIVLCSKLNKKDKTTGKIETTDIVEEDNSTELEDNDETNNSNE